MFFAPAHAQVYMGIWTPHYIKENYSNERMTAPQQDTRPHPARVPNMPQGAVKLYLQTDHLNHPQQHQTVPLHSDQPCS